METYCSSIWDVINNNKCFSYDLVFAPLTTYPSFITSHSYFWIRSIISVVTRTLGTTNSQSSVHSAVTYLQGLLCAGLGCQLRWRPGRWCQHSAVAAVRRTPTSEGFTTAGAPVAEAGMSSPEGELGKRPRKPNSPPLRKLERCGRIHNQPALCQGERGGARHDDLKCPALSCHPHHPTPLLW